MPQLQQQKKPVEYPLLNFISNPTLEPEEYERRWQQMDGKIYADVTSVLGHIGNLPFSGCLKDRLKA